MTVSLTAASAFTNCKTSPQSEQILIIGAGMAGLSAARILHDSGHVVTIIEGRDRIGGRVWTSQLWPDAPMDLGASWIHGSRNNPITDLADEIGTPRLKTDYDNGLLYSQAGRRLPDRAWNRYASAMRDVRSALNEAGRLDTDMSIEAAVDRYINPSSLSDEDRQHLNFVLNSNFEQEWSGSIADLSAQHIDEGSAFGGPDMVFVEGYGTVPAFLADRLDIKLDEAVTKVSHTASGVTVETENGVYEADRVIVTLPLGVLKRGSVTFDPPLPAEKRAVIDQLGVGVLNKTYLRFAEPFWQKRPEWFWRLNTQRGVWTEWFNIYHYFDIPILLAFNAADFGTEIEGWTDAEIVGDAMAVLRSMYGPETPEPESVQITRWIADPFAGGSYSYPAVDAPANARAILAEPVDDRLFFAGEATSSDYPATVHGAYLSGVREAQRILDRG